MNGTHDKRIAVRAKVAFLGLFVLALVAAKFVVALRSAIVLGKPIELAYSGFSVSMPKGNGWNGPRGWDYSGGKITLLGTFAPGSWKPTALAKCSYVFPSEIADPKTRLEQRRRTVEGEIVDSGQIETESLIVDWVRIDQAGGYSYIFGTADLPDQRRVEIEVQESTGDLDLAQSTFNAIVSSLSVTHNPLLESGAKMIAGMKDRGLSEALDNYDGRSLYLIRDSKRRSEIIGFATDVLIDTGGRDESNIEAMGLYYTEGDSPYEEMTFFQSDNRFDRFTWKTDSVGRERTSIGLTLEDTGILKVTKSVSSSIEDAAKAYKVSRATAPDILLEQLLARMIDDGLEETLVDMITPYGSIVPTHISQIRPESTETENAAYLVKLTPLDGRGFFQFAYLDDQKRILESLVQGRDTLLFRRATPQEAADIFRKRSGLILEDEKLRQYLMDEMM